MLQAVMRASTSGQTAAWRVLYSSTFSGRSRLQRPIRRISTPLSVALAQKPKAPLDRRTFDRLEVPVYAQSRRSAGKRMALVNLHPIGGNVVELRNIFEPARVGNGAAERDMQLHEEMRADADVERLSQMRGLQPRGYAADARDVDLNDRTSPPLQIVAELRRTIEAFAARDRNRRGARKPGMALDVVGG